MTVFFTLTTSCFLWFVDNDNDFTAFLLSAWHSWVDWDDQNVPHRSADETWENDEEDQSRLQLEEIILPSSLEYEPTVSTCHLFVWRTYPKNIETLLNEHEA